MAWSPQQDAALKAVAAWLRRGEPQVFRLFGYAGTGKTTLAKQIADDAEGEVAFGAFTGKAALVLKSKGCRGASTIHSMIYRTQGEEEDATPSFVLNRKAAANDADLIIIDECSMVDEELGRDLLSFGKPVLVLGDSAQLPPVKGGGFFTDAEPDVMLTEVHRQAADNPIIAMATTVREGGRLRPGHYGSSEVVGAGVNLDADRVLAADQVLVGTNRSRRANNARFRELHGRGSSLPVPGDKLVCLRNNRAKRLLNGGLWQADRVEGHGAKINIDIASEDVEGVKAKVSVPIEFFTGDEGKLDPRTLRNVDQFDYGYALTVHKAQGSQWDDVVLFDESFAFREHGARWLYTGLTRAAKTITVVV